MEIVTGEGRTKGRLFQRKLNRAKLCEFEDDFFSILEQVQTSTTLIDEKINIREDAGILRTLRRGVTDHCLNMNVDTELLKVVHRWASETQSRSIRSCWPYDATPLFNT